MSGNGTNGTSAPRRKRRWDSVAPTVDTTSDAAKLKAQQAELIRLQIAQRLKAIQAPMQAAAGMTYGQASVQSLGAANRFSQNRTAGRVRHVTGGAKQWVALRLDSQGREIDEDGNVIESGPSGSGGVVTLKVNQKREVPEEKQQMRPPPAINKYLDPRIAITNKRALGKRKTLNFVKQGKYQRKAQALRMEQISHQLRQDRRIVGGDKAGTGVIVLPSKPIMIEDIPDIEWWDEKILGKGMTYANFDLSSVPPTVTLKVHHPVQLAPPTEEEPPAPRPLQLTTKERKKIKRMSRLEKERERQDLVSAGLIPPKEPRLKLSNMMQILMDEAVADPSAVEAKVRAQMAKRAQAHLEHNSARKLSGQEKREKLRKKLQEDTSIKSSVLIYSTPSLSSKQIRFKIDMNAQQYNMTGIGIISDICNVVVLEGGVKGAKKFKGLMERRIKWVQAEDVAAADDSDDSEAEEIRAKKNKPKLIWEGVQSQRKFLNFRFETCSSEPAARKFFADKGLEHYWDQCLNDKLLSKKEVVV